MRRQVLIAVTFLAGCVVGGVSSQMVAPPARAGIAYAKWEYYCFTVSNEPDPLTKNLNDLGQQGWELTSATGQGDYNSYTTLCMKRARP
jgi:hypothetical protein